jgi:hypothetical protein
MASSPDRPQLSDLEEGWDGVFYDSLVWVWVPAENEPPQVRLKRDGETEPWVTWELDGGEMHSEERRPETAFGSDDSRA